jgi:hypothetical protein
MESRVVIPTEALIICTSVLIGHENAIFNIVLASFDALLQRPSHGRRSTHNLAHAGLTRRPPLEGA